MKMMTCPDCGRAVKIRQQWHYNRTWFYIHCKCGRHRKSEQRWRGESTEGLKENLINSWENEI